MGHDQSGSDGREPTAVWTRHPLCLTNVAASLTIMIWVSAARGVSRPPVR